MDSELGQNSTNRFSDTNISRHGVLTDSRHGSPWTERMDEHEQSNEGCKAGHAPHSPSVGISSGENKALGSLHTTREASAATHSEMDRSTVVSSQRELERLADDRQESDRGLTLAHTQTSEEYRGTTTAPSSNTGYVHRCLDGGMGSLPKPPNGTRTLEPSGTEVSHKHPGDESCSLRLSGIRTSTSSQQYASACRQHHSCCIHKEGGGHTFLETHGVNTRVIEVVRRTENKSTSNSHCGSTQRDSGLTVETGPNASQRMESVGSRVQQGDTLLGYAGDRSHGHGDQPCSQELHFPSPTSGSTGSRRVQDPMADKHVTVHIPTTQHCSQNPTISAGQKTAESNSDSVYFSDESIPPRSQGNGVTEANTSVPNTRNTVAIIDAGNQPSLSYSAGTLSTGSLANLRPPVASSSRIDSITNLLRSQGVPEKVIQLAKRPQRPSTAGVYNNQWEHFVEFCRENNYKPFEISEGHIAEYLLSLFDRGCAPSTIKVHRAAISSVLKHSHPRISKSIIIGDLLTRIDLERPREKRILPKFDIDLVLRQLLLPPFVDKRGSDLGIPLLYYAYKTAFLLALATGARVSEVHEFSRDPRCLIVTKDKHSEKVTMTVYTRPGFIAKNAKPTLIKTPMNIHSLKHMYGREEKERLLCPVRAVTVYISKTPNGPYKASDDRILRHPTPTITTRKNVVALWIRKTVELCYKSAKDKPDLIHVNAHEVRAVAHSLVAYNGASLEEILEGGKWGSKESFFKHYLRDLTHTAAGNTVPVVAGGRLLNT